MPLGRLSAIGHELAHLDLEPGERPDGFGQVHPVVAGDTVEVAAVFSAELEHEPVYLAVADHHGEIF